MENNGLEIAVIGMSGRFPGANNIHEYWNNLCRGEETITFFTTDELLQKGVSPELIHNKRFIPASGVIQDRECFDAAFFGYTDIEAKVMDPQSRILHEVVWEALEDSGCIPDTYEGNIGLFAGAASSLKWEANTFLSGNDDTLGRFSTSILANRDFMCTGISYKLNLKGPSMFIQTACSTSLVAIHEACRAILTGECQVALAGGVTIGYDSREGYMYEEGMIFSKDGHCKPFDHLASGTVPSEGACIVVLKSLEDAINDHDAIYAVIKGTAINNDGQNKVGYTSPSVQGQESVINMAHSVAEVDSKHIGYIEAHGTGTSLGDMIEIEALKQVFKTADKGSCVIGSVKSNVGHMDCAAGAAGFIKTVMILKNEVIPPTCHFQNENPRLHLSESPFSVNAQLISWENEGEPRYAGVSSFGIGGTNAHAVLAQFQDNQELESNDGQDELILLSANSTHTLLQMKNNLQHFITHNQHIRTKDISYTLQTGRKHLPLRTYAIVSSNRDNQILKFREIHNPSTGQKTKQRPVIFMMNDVGDGILEHARSLYQCDSLFKEIANGCADSVIAYITREHISAKSDWLPLDIVMDKPWLLTYIYAKYLLTKGVMPSCISGSGYGVIVALCLSGILNIQDMIKILYQLPTTGDDKSAALDLLAQIQLPACPQIPLLSPVTGEWWKESEFNWEDIYPSLLVDPEQVENQCLEFIKEELEIPIVVTFSQLDAMKTLQNSSDINILDFSSNQYHSILDLIGIIWGLSGTVDWKAFNTSRSNDCYTVHLPSYPFEKTKYPFEHHQVQLSKFQVEAPSEEKRTEAFQLYIPGWQISRRENTLNNKTQLRTCVVFCKHTLFCDKLLDDLGHNFHRVISVFHGDAFGRSKSDCFYIQPSREEDFIRLVETLRSEDVEVDAFIFAWYVSNDREERLLSQDIVTNGLNMGFFSIKYLAGALKHGAKEVKIIYLTNNMQKVQGDRIFFPEISTVLGAIQVLPEEDKRFICKSVDISWNDINHSLTLEMIRDEIEYYPNDQIVCLRGNERLIPTYHSSQLDEVPDFQFHDHGIYVIVGGIGALGLEASRYILRQATHPKFIFIQRTSLPPEDQWDQIDSLMDHGLLDKIRQLKDLMRNGASIQTISADISDAEEMMKVVHKIYKDYGKINGLIHCGGIAKGGFLQDLQTNDFMEQFAAKVYGTIHLEPFLTDLNPDFVLFYSSVNAFNVSAGASGYSAANCFLDAYASYRSSATSTQVCSINWPAWKQAGMAVENLNRVKQQFIYPNIYEINNDRGECQYYTILSKQAHWVLDEHKVNGVAVMPGTGYVNLVATIFKKFNHLDQFTIHNMDMLNPLYITDDEWVEVFVTVTNEKRFEIRSKNQLHSKWVLNVKGSFVVTIDHTLGLPFREIQIQDAEDINVVKMKNYNSIQFGPRWRNNIYGYDIQKNALHLSLPKQFHHDLNSEVIHPALMDAAMLIFPEHSNKVYMPLHYDHISVFRSLPADIISFIQVSAQNKDMQSYDYSMYTLEGEPVLDIKGYTLFEVKQMNFSSENSSEAYNNMNDEIFDDFFNHGISNEEGTKMLSQIIHSGFSRIVVSQEEPQIRPGRRLIRHTISHNVAEQQINSNEKVTPTTKRQPHKKNMNEIKSALQSIWQDLLGVADVDVYANYFDDLGATSIHVIQANENIHKRLHREVSITEFYNHPTIHSFSLFLSDENEEDAIASQNNATNKKNANLKKRKQRMEQQLYHKEREYE